MKIPKPKHIHTAPSPLFDANSIGRLAHGRKAADGSTAAATAGRNTLKISPRNACGGLIIPNMTVWKYIFMEIIFSWKLYCTNWDQILILKVLRHS
jgi:hypothetical protein